MSQIGSMVEHTANFLVTGAVTKYDVAANVNDAVSGLPFFQNYYAVEILIRADKDFTLFKNTTSSAGMLIRSLTNDESYSESLAQITKLYVTTTGDTNFQLWAKCYSYPE